MKIQVVISGRSYHVAEHLPTELDLPDGASVDDALAKLAALLPQEASLPGSCLISIGQEHLGSLADHAFRTLKDGDELFLMAPVAGG